MTTPALAFAAAAAGLLAAWELLAALERARPVRWLTRVLEPLRRAGAEASVGERRRMAVLAAGALLAAGTLVAGPVAGVVAAFGGRSLSVALLRARRRRYEARLGEQAAESARALADAVAAGHAVRGAVAAAAMNVAGPARRELAAVAAALALGEPTDAALERLRLRARSRAWDTLMAALLLQRDAGGDLAGVLRRLAASLEAAARAEAEARSATAQARFTAYLVAALPLIGLAVAELGSPGFVMGLLAAPLSATLAACALVLQAIALVLVRRLAAERRL